MVTKEKLDAIASNIRQGYGFFKSCQMEGVTAYSEVGRALGARNKGKKHRKTENVVLKETWKKVEEKQKNKVTKSGQLEFDLGI